MPYSSDSGKKVIRTILERLSKYHFSDKPLKALDIGAGSATYPKLVNSILAQDITWTGVEIWEPYVEQFQLNTHYQKLIIKDARTAVTELFDNGHEFELIFIGDVLEHMSREVASNVLDTCKRMLTPNGMLIVSVPIGEYPQDEYLGNPHEAHVDTWSTLDELYRELAIEPIDQRLGSNVAKCVLEQEIGVGFYTSKQVILNIAPKIAAYMICKDEETFIGRCIESLDGVDELVIADTGSTDGTKAVISYHAHYGTLGMNVPLKLKEINVSPWRFDDARNFALGYVSRKIDLCISIDADEVLDEQFITQLKSEYWDSIWLGEPFTRLYHSFMTHWNWNKPDEQPNVSRHFHERVHSRYGYRWIYPVHEKLVATNEVPKWCTAALMIQKPDNSKNRSSYGPLLEQTAKEDPTDWKIWSFLANERSAAGNISGALEALSIAASLPDSDKVFICWRRAAFYEHLKKPDEAFEALTSAASHNPNLRETYVMLSELCDRQGWSDRKAHYLARAKSCKQETQGYLRREELWINNWEQTA